MKIPLGLLIAFLGQLPVPQTAQQSTQPAPPVVATASIEGTVFRSGTNEAIAGADVELTRVEGTAAAPMTPQATQYVSTMLQGGGPGGPLPPPVIAPEVKYAKTGSDGKFAFKDLKEGKYRLVSIRVGGAFYPTEYGQHDPRQRGLSFPIREGEAVKDVKIEMMQTGAIAGRVLDEDGEAMGHMIVMALEEQYREGQRFLNMMQSVATDENGNYRLYWLAPGPYYVAAVYEDPQRRTINPDPIPPGRRGPSDRATSPVVLRSYTANGDLIEETYAVVYNGSVTDWEKTRAVEVRAGLTTAGVDIPMGAGKVRVHHLRGVVINGANGQAGAASIVAVPKKVTPNAVVLNGSTEPNGGFDLAGAMPGTTYSLFAMTTTSNTAGIPAATIAAAAAAGVTLPGSGTTLIGYMSVEVSNSDVNGLRIVTNPGINLTGRVGIEGRPQSDNDPDLARMRLNLRRDPDTIASASPMAALPPTPNSPGVAAVARPPNGAVFGNGSFTAVINTGDFKVSVSPLPPGMFVKSMRMGNTDVLSDGLHITGQPDGALEVVIGSGGAELSGVVSGGGLRVAPNSVVALVPDALALRKRVDLYRSATTDHEGRFKLQNVLPGTYKLFAWEYAPTDAWFDPAFIQLYESFRKSVSLRDGEKQETAATVIPLRRGL
jgi:hypothetical protein